MHSELEEVFPGLRETRYEVTSPEDPSYNCIAWAAQDVGRWWWPSPQGYWPQDPPRQPAMKAFIEAFRKLGYEKCEDSSLEARWEKIAIYAKEDGSPTHAARQREDGTWTSKLGKYVDIAHESLSALCGEQYGRPVIIMRRLKGATARETVGGES